jgi:5-methyltetrahydropteroyltriglutamate--homocysteine methyltransferase
VAAESGGLLTLSSASSRILTTHAGSLPRPPELTRLYARRVRGEAVDAAEIVAAGREAMRQVVADQIGAGLDVINDGEQRRESFILYMRHRLSGIGGAYVRNRAADLDAYPAFSEAFEAASQARFSVSNAAHTPQATGAVRYLDPAQVSAECDEFADVLAGHAGRFAGAFLTAPSPGVVSTIIANAHYDSAAAYLDALGAALKVEYEAIAARGWVLQIDAPDLAMERHVAFRDRPLSDFLDFAAMAADVLNRALANVPRDQVRVHVCWGNYEGPHDCDVGLADILPVIATIRAGAVVLPFANGRHAHEYRVLSRTPLAEDQILVAGVIDTLTNVVEHPEAIADRLERIAAAVGGPERLWAGTDCGFDTSAGNSRLARDVAWAKLRALAEGARIASARLF